MSVIGKTGAREIFITDAAAKILEATPSVGGCEYVFAGHRYGQPLTSVHKGLRAVRDVAGIVHFPPYGLRYTAATGALAAGVAARAVQELLGHAYLKSTTIYLHAKENRRQQAAEGAAIAGRAVLRVVENDEH
jgi:integrase